ncbi:DUF3164 family protein [Devosia sediminis]|uniref:DUF3164 family protein n=1 Tax=Devosia sediminis TaxID=2798801 RepID=A0A934IV83_9HYPH|nr:DUF3164 family protein [Devosia sediminis]MBJ3783388.1 DUF3164 family protein [Devosia sediminis]
MTHQSTFTPAPVPTGIIDHAGQQFMADPRGALVPVTIIKPADKLQDEKVREIMGWAIGLSEQVSRFKVHTMEDLAKLDGLLEQEYGLVKRGNKGKGNRTYMTVDGLFKVSVSVADSIDFGPELQVAKALLDECMNEWAADARPEIQAIITRAFNTDKEGKINRSEIFTLLRLAIEDERWQRAMTAIRDAMRVVGRKEYVRFGMRSSPEAEWSSISIDLAQA